MRFIDYNSTIFGSSSSNSFKEATRSFNSGTVHVRYEVAIIIIFGFRSRVDMQSIERMVNHVGRQPLSCPRRIKASITPVVHGIADESTGVGPIKVQPATIVLTKLISIIRNKLINALSNPRRGELAQLSEPLQRSSVQIHADVTHCVAAVEGLILCDVDDAAVIGGTLPHRRRRDCATLDCREANRSRAVLS